jgi:hypothetical protein
MFSGFMRHRTTIDFEKRKSPQEIGLPRAASPGPAASSLREA